MLSWPQEEAVGAGAGAGVAVGAGASVKCCACPGRNMCTCNLAVASNKHDIYNQPRGRSCSQSRSQSSSQRRSQNPGRARVLARAEVKCLNPHKRLK